MHARPQPRQAQSLASVLQKIGEPLFAEWRPRNVAAHRVDTRDLNQLPQQFARIKHHGTRYEYLGLPAFQLLYYRPVFRSRLHAFHRGFGLSLQLKQGRVVVAVRHQWPRPVKSRVTGRSTTDGSVYGLTL